MCSDGVEAFFRDRDICQDTGVKTRDNAFNFKNRYDSMKNGDEYDADASTLDIYKCKYDPRHLELD